MRAPAARRDIESFLVISQRRLGDIALEIPSLGLLRAAYPGATLAVVAPASYHPLLQLACRPEFLLDFPSGPGSTLRLYAALRRHHWDVAVDLTTDYHLFPAFLAAASGASIRIGFENAGRERLFNVIIPLDEREHMTERFRRPLKVLGIRDENFSGPDMSNPALPPASLPPKAPEQRRVGLHPGGTHWTQRWPADYFARLAGKIRESGDQCVVLGREENRTERTLVNEIVQLSGCSATPVFANGVLELAAALQELDLLVCNNSGPLHLAGLLRVPTLSFMGPTVKERWWPRGPNARVLRQDHLPCIGCNLGYCKIDTHACMKEITPEAAFKACTEILKDGLC